MAFETKNLDELIAIGKGVIKGEMPEADVSDGSDYDMTIRMVATIAEGQQAQADYQARQIFPATADEDGVLMHAERCGLSLQPAAKASGRVQVQSSSAVTQLSGSELTAADGTTFTATSAASCILPSWTGKTAADGSSRLRIFVLPDTTGMAAGHLVRDDNSGSIRAIREVISSINLIELWEPFDEDVFAANTLTAIYGGVMSIVASEAGASGNKLVGDTLTLSSPVVGISATTRILELNGGGDEEEIEELRARVVATDALRPPFGSSEYIRTIARETPGVRLADAIVYPAFRGLGTVDVVPLGLDGSPIVSTANAALVKARLEEFIPRPIQIAVEPATLTVSETKVGITVYCERGYEPDLASMPALTISTGCTTTEIRHTSVGTPFPVGTRLLFSLKVGGRWGVYERKVVAAPSAGLTILDSPLPRIPVSLDPQFRASGPLGLPVAAALDKVFAELGPSIGTSGFERHPQPSILWDQTLRRNRIIEAVLAIEGVVDVSLTDPVSDAIATTPKQILRKGEFEIRLLPTAY